MDINEIESIVSGEPAYRIKQIKKWVYQDLIADWNQALNLPKALRDKLSSVLPLKITGQEISASDQKTIKAVIKLSDSKKVEAVLMRHADHRNTVCVSCQVGCPNRCSFCATGKMGFIRNLTSSEIISQVIYIARGLGKSERITNVVFMGMGEPFMNFEEVKLAINTLHDRDAFDIGARKISISTVGITEGIRELSDFPLQVNLAISLHASNNEIRSSIMPINEVYPIGELFSAIEEYISKTNRRVMLEYLMIEGVNDSLDCARALASIINKMRKPLVFVNLIGYNEVEAGLLGYKYKPSSPHTVLKFMHMLQKYDVHVTRRYRFGHDIHGACGQLATSPERAKNEPRVSTSARL